MNRTREEIAENLMNVATASSGFLSARFNNLLKEAAEALVAPTPTDDVLTALRDLEKKLDEPDDKVSKLTSRMGMAKVAIQDGASAEIILGMLDGTMKYYGNTVVWSKNNQPVGGELAARMDAAPVGTRVVFRNHDYMWYEKHEDGLWHYKNDDRPTTWYKSTSFGSSRDWILTYE